MPTDPSPLHRSDVELLALNERLRALSARLDAAELEDEPFELALERRQRKDAFTLIPGGRDDAS